MPSQHQTSSHRIKDRVIDLLASLWPIIGFVGAAIWALFLNLVASYVYECLTKPDCPSLSLPLTWGIFQPLVPFVSYSSIKIIMASLAFLSLILTIASFFAHRGKSLTIEKIQTAVSDVITERTKEPFGSIKLKQRQIVYLKEHDLFVGRSTELDDIHNFLLTRSRGYIFVTGQSGFGKTALLANLIKPKPDAFVWYFFNQLDRGPRSNTKEDFLQQMCEQLLPYYPKLSQGEAILTTPESRLEALYTKMMEMEPNQRLIMVIDSIDEAEGNFISNKHIPHNLPKGVFIIFSARQVQQKDSEQKQDFPGRLGLPKDDLLSIRLEALPSAGIEELLRKAGGKAIEWADDPTKLEQVERVSEGDPFYLRYLVEDIANGKITLKQIKQKPEGLDQYLDGWWRQVVEDIGDTQIKDFMGILVVALGPLPRDDLFRLFPAMGPIFDQKKFQRVRRFVFESKVVSRKKGELAVYTLCHARFKDYITEKKLPENTVAMYQEQLLAYCAQRKYDSLYTLQFYSTHLLEAAQQAVKIEDDQLKAEELYRELLTLVNERFLEAKIRHLQSYTSVLTDLKNVMHAAAELQDRAKLLGLALAYNGLQEKAVQLADTKVIPLYARFGKPELALELTEMISDETERAKTRIDVAKELLSSKPDLAREIIRQVLANWQRYKEGYEQGEMLVQVFALLPEELVSFLERLDDFSPIYSLVSFIKDNTPYSTAAFDQVVRHVDLALQERFRAALVKALSSAKPAYSQSNLRFLLARWEPDPTKAAAFAESEAAQIIVQVKRERLEQTNNSLTEQTINRTIHLFLTGNPKPNEEWALVHLVAAPHAHQFLTALNKLDSTVLITGGLEGKSGRKQKLLLEIGEVLADEHDITEAKKFLSAYLEDCEKVARLLNKPLSEVYAYASSSPIYLVREISESLAVENLQAGLDFLELPEVVKLRQEISSSIMVLSERRLLRKAANENPEAALPIVEREWPRQEWAWHIIAEGLARVDLEQALTLWHKHDPDKEDTSKVLINILDNAPPEWYQPALEALEQDFTQELPYYLYKVPVLLDIALRLKQDQPESAKTIALSAIDNLRKQFEKEGWGGPKQDLFLVRIIPAVAACGPDLIQKAVYMVRWFTEKYGLELIAAADLLCLLAKSRDVPGLRERFRQFHKDGAESALPTRNHHPLTDQNLSHLNSLITNEESYGYKPSGPLGEVLVAFVEWLSKTNSGQLINLYLLHHAYEEELYLRPDYIKALLAIKTFPFYDTDISHFVERIKDVDVWRLTIIDLYNKLPLTMITQHCDFGRAALEAIAWVRVADRERNLQKKQEWFKAAFKAAEKSFKDLQDDFKDPKDGFTLDLLFQFVREVKQIDIEDAAEQAEQFAKRVIDEVLKIPRDWVDDWKVERLFELGECGYCFSREECENIQQRADQCIDELERHPNTNTKEGHRDLSLWLISMAQSTMYVDRDRGIKFIKRAIRHASLLTEQSVRRFRQQRILRCLLESGDTSMWEQAVWFSLDFGDAIFETFDLFGSTLLKMKQEDKELPLRLKEVIEWAEQIWRI